jgi:hypothetical protein
VSKGKTGFRKDVFKKQVMTSSSGSERKNHGTEFYGLEVQITPYDKQRLEKFCIQEMGYFNHLVDGLSSRVRSFPEALLEFDDNWVKVFGAVAANNKRVTHLLKAQEDSELPPLLEPYRTLLLGSDSKGNRFLTERNMLLLDLAAGPGLLLPIVRKNLATEAMKHYKEQASRILTPGAKKPANAADDEEDAVYKIAPEMLEIVDSDRKRHLQIPKIGLQVTWNEASQSSLIGVEYASKPIVVPGVNLQSEHDWNFIILHQEPGHLVTPETPWVIDVRKIHSGYLLKYLDSSRSFRSKAYDINRRGRN